MSSPPPRPRKRQVSVPRPPKPPKNPKGPRALGGGKTAGVWATLTDTDEGWAEAADMIASVKTAEIEVGYFKNHKAHGRKGTRRVNTDGSRAKKPRISVFQRAAFNQWGVANENVPARPFMTTGFDQQETAIEALLTANFAKATTSEQLIAGLRKSGTDLQMILRNLILAWDDPGNAPMTVDMKGFDDPLVETSEMANAPIVRFNFKAQTRPPREIVIPTPSTKNVPGTRRGRGKARGARVGGSFSALFTSLSNAGAVASAMRAPGKSASKKATKTRFRPRARAGKGGSANRG